MHENTGLAVVSNADERRHSLIQHRFALIGVKVKLRVPRNQAKYISRPREQSGPAGDSIAFLPDLGDFVTLNDYLDIADRGSAVPVDQRPAFDYHRPFGLRRCTSGDKPEYAGKSLSLESTTGKILCARTFSPWGETIRTMLHRLLHLYKAETCKELCFALTKAQMLLYDLTYAFVVIALFAAALSVAAQDPSKQAATPPAPKNLKVLTADVNVRQVMQRFTVGLGVQCSYCHVAGDFASDENPKKEIARKMLLMIKQINRNFPDAGNDFANSRYLPFPEGKQYVTCYACH